jgi:hypothetical protein
MAPDPAAWRCPVCEGVNHGGRVCTTCGEQLPAGFVPQDAVRRPAPAPRVPTVVPAPRRPRSSMPPSSPGATRPPTPEEIFGSNPFYY